MIEFDQSYYVFVVDTTADATLLHEQFAAYCTEGKVPQAMQDALEKLKAFARDEVGELVSSTEVRTPGREQEWGGIGFLMDREPSKKVQDFILRRAKMFASEVETEMEVLGFRLLKISTTTKLCSDSYDTDIQPFVKLGYPVKVHEAGDDEDGIIWYEIRDEAGESFGGDLDSKCWFKDKKKAEAFAKRINNAIPKYKICWALDPKGTRKHVVCDTYGKPVSETQHATREEAEAELARLEAGESV